jgi:hypothetical protein
LDSIRPENLSVLEGSDLMKVANRVKSALVVSALVLGASTSAAIADDASNQEAKATYRTQVTAFKASISTWKASKEAIKATFATAKASAIATRDAALSAAGTDSVQISAAKAAFRSAMDQAKATREAGIAQLGVKPSKPVKPVS